MEVKWILAPLMFLLLTCLTLSLGCDSSRVIVSPDPSDPPAQSSGPPPWAPGHGYEAKYHYRYYPSVRVYYDTGRRLYFYHSDGNWQVGASLPRSLKIAREDYVVVEMNTGHPYEYHGDVVRRYFPGLEQKASQQEKKRRRH